MSGSSRPSTTFRQPQTVKQRRLGWRNSSALAHSRPSALLAVLLTTFSVGLLARPCAAQEIVKLNSSGPVSVRTTLAPESPTIGDEITLTIEVTSEKDVEVLMPEFAEALQSYTIIDFVPRERIEDDGTAVRSQKYTLQPYISGEQFIPPILIEFIDNRVGQKPSPDDFDAYEILTDRIDFTVQSVILDSAAAQLKPPLGELQPIEQRGNSYLLIGSIAILLALASIVFGIVTWTRKRKRARRINAFEIAYLRLQRLLNDRLSPEPTFSIEQFFVEISDIIRRYLEDRFELRAPELTTDEFLQLAAAESELSREHQNLLSEFLKQADIVKFAGVQATEDEVRRSSDLALKFINETRADAPDIVLAVDDQDPPPPTLEQSSASGRRQTTDV